LSRPAAENLHRSRDEGSREMKERRSTDGALRDDPASGRALRRRQQADVSEPDHL